MKSPTLSKVGSTSSTSQVSIPPAPPFPNPLLPSHPQQDQISTPLELQQAPVSTPPSQLNIFDLNDIYSTPSSHQPSQQTSQSSFSPNSFSSNQLGVSTGFLDELDLYGTNFNSNINLPSPISNSHQSNNFIQNDISSLNSNIPIQPSTQYNNNQDSFSASNMFNLEPSKTEVFRNLSSFDQPQSFPPQSSASNPPNYYSPQAPGGYQKLWCSSSTI